ncbi:MAG: hypothetical protein JSR96_10405 [Proteobacteria bacterium]|nr:hypothetical protein [Pseudomonadota bacterium]
MSLHLVTPSEPAQELAVEDDLPPPGKGWRGHAADTCYILLKAGSFLATTYLMTLGLPLLFFLMISGGDVELFFAQLANFADRFLGADPDRQVGFVNELKFGLISLATLVACLRLPGFLCEVNEGLREERP